jgi:hypothetical protein
MARRCAWREGDTLSSSETEPTTRAFVQTSLATLREEFPEAYYLMCRKLAGLAVALFIDGEEIPIVFEPRSARVVHDPPSPPDVRARTTRRTILDVLDARLSLQGAVDSGALELWGPIEDLEAFHAALLLYVQGAVRSPSFPGLLDRFREAYFISTARPTPGSSSSQE